MTNDSYFRFDDDDDDDDDVNEIQTFLHSSKYNESADSIQSQILYKR